MLMLSAARRHSCRGTFACLLIAGFWSKQSGPGDDGVRREVRRYARGSGSAEFRIKPHSREFDVQPSQILAPGTKIPSPNPKIQIPSAG